MRRFSVVTALCAVVASVCLLSCSRTDSEAEQNAHTESRISLHLKKIRSQQEAGNVAQRLP